MITHKLFHIVILVSLIFSVLSGCVQDNIDAVKVEAVTPQHGTDQRIESKKRTTSLDNTKRSGKYVPKYIKNNALELTTEEIEVYERYIEDIALAAKSTAIARWNKNNEFHQKYGVSSYWPAKRGKQYLGGYKAAKDIPALMEDSVFKENKGLLEKMEVSDCTIHLHATLKMGFKIVAAKLKKANKGNEAANLMNVFNKFNTYALKLNKKIYPDKKGGHNGLAYAKTLRYLGWKTYYWNAASTYNEAMGFQKKYDEGGYHGNHYWHVIKANNDFDSTNMSVPIDNRTEFVGMKSPPKRLKNIDYCIASMNVDSHVFPIVNGDVIEGHATFDHDKKESIERAEFNPYGTLDPKFNKYHESKGGRTYGPALLENAPGLSGVIAIPPHQAF